jgi:hypothetical protein
MNKAALYQCCPLAFFPGKECFLPHIGQTQRKDIGLLYKNIWPATPAHLNDKFKVLVYQAIND